ncbi:MAG: exopolysaccharide biosynthesis polyprenyl glycosylphosphotransferase [Ignavibacteriales bacterium]|nr:exopolysaccharide biosynthesis polyprenyl glycosylphosphotransferase [Ignavibacteriales bacterium]
MRKRTSFTNILFLVSDLLAITISALLAALYSISPLVIPKTTFTLDSLNLQYVCLLACIVWYFSSRSTGLNDSPARRTIRVDVIYLLRNIVSQIVFLILGLFVVKERVLTRHFVIAYSLMLLLFSVLNRSALRYLYRRLKKRMLAPARAIVIGSGGNAHAIREKLAELSADYECVGLVASIADLEKKDNAIGTIDDLQSIVEQYSIDTVFVALEGQNPSQLSYIVDISQKYALDLKIVPNFATYSPNMLRYSFLGEIPIATVNIDRLAEAEWRIIKRIFDFVVTSFLIVFVCSWLVPIIAILQIVLNRGPVFYRAERLGRKGKSFFIYKFRTMKTKIIESESERTSLTKQNDKRVTRFGGFLRKTSLDELPQFFNVLRGDMSLVGPRPLDTAEALRMKNLIQNFVVRDYVKPGITGWAQINGYRSGTGDLELMRKRIELDRWYIINWTVGLDIRICFATAFKIIFGDPYAR